MDGYGTPGSFTPAYGGQILGLESVTLTAKANYETNRRRNRLAVWASAMRAPRTDRMEGCAKWAVHMYGNRSKESAEWQLRLSVSSQEVNSEADSLGERRRWTFAGSFGHGRHTLSAHSEVARGVCCFRMSDVAARPGGWCLMREAYEPRARRTPYTTGAEHQLGTSVPTTALLRR